MVETMWSSMKTHSEKLKYKVSGKNNSMFVLDVT